MNFKEYLEKGGAVIIHDGSERENEADLIFYAGAVDKKKIAVLRKDAGGLICVALSDELSNKLNLPFKTEILSNDERVKDLVVKKTPYGDRPAFSITVNHKGTHTGITDEDRAKTINGLFEIIEREYPEKEFRNDFYTPGHVHLLRASPNGKRCGHTELSVKLAEKTGLKGVMVLCEMLDDETGKALSFEKTKMYAEKYGIPVFSKKELEVLYS
ncbi:3,4-dihydroxy-2-butanone-4-phosphate synthase [Candidatus Micrarchaeota archaeon]|nr:3,4-dihydroxy-2-butanone-4-phosphate synthase [Candidatus Micrarchaeota archaeon]